MVENMDGCGVRGGGTGRIHSSVNLVCIFLKKMKVVMFPRMHSWYFYFHTIKDRSHLKSLRRMKNF